MSNFFAKIRNDFEKGISSANKGKSGGGTAAGSSKNSNTYRGGGKSLGGNQPGKILSVSLPNPGPLGLKVEKRSNNEGGAIVSMVVPGGQAEAAGLKRGDIVCWPNTDGKEEISFKQFLQMAGSDMRPLVFDIRRIDSTAGGGGSGASSSLSSSSKSSADSYARKQAVIAAAEAREKAHKAKTKPQPKKKEEKLPTLLSTAEKRKLEEQRQELARQRQAEGHNEAMSEQAKKAVEAAKADEAAHAAQLGYNPYATAKMNSGQAKTATVTMTHGEMKGSSDDSGSGGGAGGGTSSSAPLAAPGTVRPPADSHTPEEETVDAYHHQPIDDAFDDALTTVITSNSDIADVPSSLSIMRKLIVNATTKGQTGDDETSAKFRRVRLSNPKIKAAITDVQGALELMLSVGFVLSENEDDDETYLVYPPGETGPTWLSAALKRMELNEKGS